MTETDTEVRLEFEPVFVPESVIIVPLVKVIDRPTPGPFEPQPLDDKKPLIINIETMGLRPWEHRIISIGLQDPRRPQDLPIVIMMDDEAQMLRALFTVIDEGGFDQAVGYGFSFDLRFVVLRAMKHGIPCQQFAEMDVYDLGQAMAQVKMAFVYYPQRQPKLSDIADFYWGYPKPFTDLEMMKYWLSGDLEKVREFTSSQITRILLLYQLFRGVTLTMFDPSAPGIISTASLVPPRPVVKSVSPLSIPEANAPETWTAKCPNDLSEWPVPIDQAEFTCPIDGTIIKRP